MAKFRPMNGYVLIEKPLVETIQGGLLLPDQAKEPSLVAKVLAVGIGEKTGKGVKKMNLKEGDKVLLTKFAGVELDFDGFSGVLIKEENVISIIK